MLKIHIRSDKAFLLYFLGVALIQILELFINIKLSKVFMIVFLAVLVCKFIRKTRMTKRIVVYYTLTLIYFLLYEFIYTLNSNFALPILIVMIVFPFMLKYLTFSKFDNWSLIEFFVIFYLLINMYLYFINYPLCFQNDAGRQFVGGSANPNLFATIIYIILLIEFWGHSLKAYCIKGVSLFLLIANGSRTYLFLGIIVVMLSLIANSKNVISLIKKVSVVFIVFLFAVIPLIHYLIQNSNILERFINKGITSNGRIQLLLVAKDTAFTSSLNDLLFGIKMGEAYRMQSIFNYSHSLGENSFLSIFVLFGVIGIIVILWYIYSVYKLNDRFIYKILVTVTLLSFLTQDTVCYVQGFLGIFGAFIVIATDIRQPEKIKLFKKRNRIYKINYSSNFSPLSERRQ